MLNQDYSISEKRLSARKNINSLFQQTQVEYFINFFNIQKKALEVGCGYGFFSSIAKPLCDELCAVDMDFSIAGSILDNKLNFFIGSGCELPFKDNTFDCVYSMDVIEHVEDDSLFLRENIRVLKKGGTLILGTPNKDRFSAGVKKMLFNPNKYPLVINDVIFGTVTHIREYDKKELVGLFKQNSEIEIKEIVPIYLGLTDPISKGVKVPPKFLENLCQFWLVKAIKAF